MFGYFISISFIIMILVVLIYLIVSRYLFNRVKSSYFSCDAMDELTSNESDLNMDLVKSKKKVKFIPLEEGSYSEEYIIPTELDTYELIRRSSQKIY